MKHDAKKQVHVVDDDLATRFALDAMLRSVGYDVALYDNGAQLLDKAATGLSGCIILDVRLPGPGGLEIQRRLQDMGCDLPVSALGELISRRVTAGASAPVDLNLVLTRIRQSENAMISLRTRQQTARDALGELLGASVQGAEIIVPDGAALSPLMAEMPQPDMVPQALSHSPVLRRAAGEIDVALTDKQRALGAVIPCRAWMAMQVCPARSRSPARRPLR